MNHGRGGATFPSRLPGWVRRTWPALVTLGVHLSILIIVLASHGRDPLELARLGTRFSAGDPRGSEGYDGQFVYFIALDPSPASVAPRLDAPAYRYQRILYPLLARLLAGGDGRAIPWTLPLVNLAAHFAGTRAMAELLAARGAARGYALAYGLWVGFAYAVRLDLTEPLAYALVAGAFLAVDRGREGGAAALFGLALFARETTVLFVAGQAVSLLLRRRWRALAWLLGLAALPFALFQFWLLRQFGAPGVASGGALATPFEWVPFRGFWQIALLRPAVFALLAALFGPMVILPSLWGLWAAARRLLAGDFRPEVLALAAAAGVMPFVPLSTYREPVALARFACGLAPALLLFAARFRARRVLNYALFSMVMLLMLVKG